MRWSVKRQFWNESLQANLDWFFVSFCNQLIWNDKSLLSSISAWWVQDAKLFLPSSSFSRAKEVGKKVLAIRCPPFRKSNYISLYSQEPGRLELWCWCQSKIKANGFLSIFQSRAGTQVGKGLQSQNGFKFTLNCWHHSLEIHRIVVTERPISPFLCFLKWT